jgi:hypothetical protein
MKRGKMEEKEGEREIEVKIWNEEIGEGERKEGRRKGGREGAFKKK